MLRGWIAKLGTVVIFVTVVILLRGDKSVEEPVAVPQARRPRTEGAVLTKQKIGKILITSVLASSSRAGRSSTRSPSPGAAVRPRSTSPISRANTSTSTPSTRQFSKAGACSSEAPIPSLGLTSPPSSIRQRNRSCTGFRSRGTVQAIDRSRASSPAPVNCRKGFCRETKS